MQHVSFIFFVIEMINSTNLDIFSFLSVTYVYLLKQNNLYIYRNKTNSYYLLTQINNLTQKRKSFFNMMKLHTRVTHLIQFTTLSWE